MFVLFKPLDVGCTILKQYVLSSGRYRTGHIMKAIESLKSNDAVFDRWRPFLLLGIDQKSFSSNLLEMCLTGTMLLTNMNCQTMRAKSYIIDNDSQ